MIFAIRTFACEEAFRDRGQCGATTAHFESRRQAVWAVLVVTQRDPTGSVEHGCGAFLKTRGWFRKLEIPSLPAVSADDSFWDDLRELCRRLNVTKLELGTFASPLGVEIPDFGTCMHRTRCAVSYTHLRAHETDSYLVCRLLL